MHHHHQLIHCTVEENGVGTRIQNHLLSVIVKLTAASQASLMSLSAAALVAVSVLLIISSNRCTANEWGVRTDSPLMLNKAL